MTRHSKDADAVFRQYREAAPDHVDDETLKKVISKCNNNPEAIQTALQNFWEDIGNKPSTDEWKTTNKTKKTEPEKPQPKSQPKIEERGGRSSDKVGRGSGGRGGGAGRGASAGRGAPPSSSDAATSAAPATTAGSTSTIAKKDKPIRQTRPSSESTTAPIVSAVSAPKTSAWASAGAGDNWAAHLKKILEKENKEKESPQVPVDELKEDISRSKDKDRRRGKSKDKSGPAEEPSKDLSNNVAKISIHDDNIGQTNTVKITEIVPSLAQSPNRNSQSNQQQENEPQVSNQEQTTFFKMGKWEIPVEETSAFQFGSFGSLGDNAAVSHSSSWGVVPDSNQNGDSSSWSNNQNNDITGANANNMGSVLLGNNNAANSNLGNRYTPKSNELEPQQQKTQNRNAPGQNRNNKHEQNQQTYGQYQAPPPGIPTPAARGPVNSMPYSYGGVYDQSQYYTPAASIVNAAAVGATGTAPAATNVNTTTPAAATPAAATQAPQQAPQQQYPPGMNGNPYGFYSPYYPNQQYYFGGQFPNVYSQGRNVYQPPRGPYGADPYGSAGSLYGDVYQSGQFPDSTGNYGNMPMHPSMPLPVAGNNAGGKTKAASSAVAGSQVPDHTAYNPYPYNRADAQQWQYQQGAAAGWGAPMMMSSAPAQQMPQQGFTQQSAMQPQPNGREAQRSNTSGASIHGNSSSFGRGNAGTEQQRW